MGTHGNAPTQCSCHHREASLWKNSSSTKETRCAGRPEERQIRRGLRAASSSRAGRPALHEMRSEGCGLTSHQFFPLSQLSICLRQGGGKGSSSSGGGGGGDGGGDENYHRMHRVILQPVQSVTPLRGNYEGEDSDTWRYRSLGRKIKILVKNLQERRSSEANARPRLEAMGSKEYMLVQQESGMMVEVAGCFQAWPLLRSR